MAYIIYYNDGKILLTLPENQVDSVTTSLDLIGKNINNYGEFFNNNLVKLLTNFASSNSNPPRSPQVGQLWYNTTTSRLSVYDGTIFRPTAGTLVSSSPPPVSSIGEFWFDTLNGQLKLYDGNRYRLIGPSSSELIGRIGIEQPPIPIRAEITNLVQKVGVVYSYGAAAGLITSSTFKMSTSSSVTYFGTTTATTVVSGVTLLQNLDVRGDFYLRGTQRTPNKNLTTYYDITSFGNPADSGASAATNLSRINAANSAIRIDLAKLFPTTTSTQYAQEAYILGSEVRVLCNYSGNTSVRRFRLEERIPSTVNWEPYELYSNAFANTLTNIVI